MPGPPRRSWPWCWRSRGRGRQSSRCWAQRQGFRGRPRSGRAVWRAHRCASLRMPSDSTIRFNAARAGPQSRRASAPRRARCSTRGSPIPNPANRRHSRSSAGTAPSRERDTTAAQSRSTFAGVARGSIAISSPSVKPAVPPPPPDPGVPGWTCPPSCPRPAARASRRRVRRRPSHRSRAHAPPRARARP